MNSRNPLIRSLALLSCIAFLGFILSRIVLASSFHPFHICVGEMEWNEGSKKWEVGLRLHPSDLATSFKRLTKKEWKEPGTSQLESNPFLKELGEFLETQVFLERIIDSEEKLEKASVSTKSKLTMVGTEEEKGWLWIYFELTDPSPIDLPKGSKSVLRIHHGLMLDDVENQTNSLLVRKGDDRLPLRFVIGESTKSISLP